MAMLLRSLRARVIARGARNFRAYADLAAAYEERVWSSNGTVNRVIRMPRRPGGRDHAVERAVHALDVEDGPGARRRLHGDPQAGRMVAAVVLAAGRPRRRGRLPPGVFNIVQGIGEEVGAALVVAPGCPPDLVHGLARDGAARSASPPRGNIVPFTGELGGKGPLIVFADCDLEAAARKAAGQYDDAGQVCLAGTRLLVEEAVPSAFLELLPPVRRRARARRSARRRDDGLAADPPASTSRGSRASSSAPGRTETRSSAAAARPSAAASGTSRRSSMPRSNDSEIVQREVFGPVLTLQTFADRGGGRRARELDRRTGSRGSSTPARRSAPSASAGRCAPGPCG